MDILNSLFLSIEKTCHMCYTILIDCDYILES